MEEMAGREAGVSLESGTAPSGTAPLGKGKVMGGALTPIPASHTHRESQRSTTFIQ